jgi:outer membrane protein OmpA-like peptidoglycan-associated protein
MFNKNILFGLSLGFALFLSACATPQPGPDKTIAGAILGAGWGAGAGAVVGNQVSSSGQGVAVGAGFGLIGGALSGASYDSIEATQVKQEEILASLKLQNLANQKELEFIQGKLDNALASDLGGAFYQVFFDADATSLRSGAIAQLELIAQTLRSSPSLGKVNVVGHSDDEGTPDYNARLSEARARTVTSYLAGQGIALDQIVVSSYGSQRPVASNTNDAGRQLNRRVDVYITR